MNSEKPESTTSESQNQSSHLNRNRLKKKQIKEQLEQTVLRKTQEKNGKSIKLDKESKATDMHINVKTNLKNCWFSHGTKNVKQSVDQVTHRQR